MHNQNNIAFQPDPGNAMGAQPNFANPGNLQQPMYHNQYDPHGIYDDNRQQHRNRYHVPFQDQHPPNLNYPPPPHPNMNAYQPPFHPDYFRGTHTQNHPNNQQPPSRDQYQNTHQYAHHNEHNRYDNHNSQTTLNTPNLPFTQQPQNIENAMVQHLDSLDKHTVATQDLLDHLANASRQSVRRDELHDIIHGMQRFNTSDAKRGPHVKPPIFSADNTMSFESWVKGIEEAFDHYNWSFDHPSRATIIPSLLSGLALLHYRKFSPQVKNNYASAIAKLEEKFGLSSKNPVVIFQQLERKQKPKEKVKDYTKDILQRMQDNDIQDEKFMLATYLKGLRSKIRTQVILMKPTSLLEAEQSAELVEQTAEEEDDTEDKTIANVKTVTFDDNRGRSHNRFEPSGYRNNREYQYDNRRRDYNRDNDRNGSLSRSLSRERYSRYGNERSRDYQTPPRFRYDNESRRSQSRERNYDFQNSRGRTPPNFDDRRYNSSRNFDRSYTQRNYDGNRNRSPSHFSNNYARSHTPPQFRNDYGQSRTSYPQNYRNSSPSHFANNSRGRTPPYYDQARGRTPPRYDQARGRTPPRFSDRNYGQSNMSPRYANNDNYNQNYNTRRTPPRYTDRGDYNNYSRQHTNSYSGQNNYHVNDTANRPPTPFREGMASTGSPPQVNEVNTEEHCFACGMAHAPGQHAPICQICGNKGHKATECACLN